MVLSHHPTLSFSYRKPHTNQRSHQFRSIGPSAQDTHTVSNAQNSAELTFYGAVLHLRGDVVTRQPHVSPQTGNVLIWNGEIFGGIFVDHHQNDGQVLMGQLEAISTEHGGDKYSALFLGIMAKIEGPYAFVYYHVMSIDKQRERDIYAKMFREDSSY